MCHSLQESTADARRELDAGAPWTAAPGTGLPPALLTLGAEGNLLFQTPVSEQTLPPPKARTPNHSGVATTGDLTTRHSGKTTWAQRGGP